VPVAGSAALIAAPSAWLTPTVGIVSGALTNEPARIGRLPAALLAMMTALAPAA
jgi:hypothetical protein